MHKHYQKDKFATIDNVLEERVKIAKMRDLAEVKEAGVSSRRSKNLSKRGSSRNKGENSK